MESPQFYMRQLLEYAHANGNGFAAMIIDENGQSLRAVNSVKSTGNKLLHAELNLMMKASVRQSVKLEGASLYSTAEPCPMCMGAILWCGIKCVYYGASIDSLKQLIPQIDIGAREMIDASWYAPELKQICADDCLSLFKDLHQEKENV